MVMEKIDWNKIKTAHGTAENIPKALEKLKSENYEERKNGYWELDNNVIVQSDLYEAAYYIIEPLIEILKKDYENGFIIELLTEISLGYAPEDIKIKNNGKNISLKKSCEEKLKENIDELKKIKEKTMEYKNEMDKLIEIIKKK